MFKTRSQEAEHGRAGPLTLSVLLSLIQIYMGFALVLQGSHLGMEYPKQHFLGVAGGHILMGSRSA